MNNRAKTKRQLLDELTAARRTIAALGAEAGGGGTGPPEERFSELLANSLPGIVYMFDAHGQLLWWNRSLELITGYAGAELAGADVLSLVGQDERPLVERKFHEAMGAGAASVEAHLVSKDGRRTPYYFNGHRVLFAGAPCLIGMGIDLTERARAEEGLRRSEARKAAILEAALDCIITVDEGGRVVEFNPAAEEVFGYARTEVLGRELSELVIPPSSRGTRRRGMDRYRATGEASFLGRRIEVLAMRADGTEFPIELAITRIAMDGPPLFTAHVRDITDRKRAERRRTARLEVAQVLAEATTVREAMPRILRAACESLGWDVGTLWVVDRRNHALCCLELWHAPAIGVEEFEAASRGATFAAGVGLPGRVWSSGQPAWIPDVTAEPNFPRAPLAVKEGLHGAFGCPVRVGGEVLGVIEFFSRRVQQPDDDLLEMMGTIGGQIGQFMERKRAEEELRRSEARKAAILEAALDCIITIDHEERILEFNPAAERTFGYPREEALGRTLSELIIPPAYRESHQRGMRRFLETGEGPVLGRRIELPAMRADGSQFPAEISIIPTLLNDRPIFTGYLRDITERKRAESEILQLNQDLERRVEQRTAELRESNAALAKASRLKDEFLANMSHELRTPLNGVIGMVDLLADSPLDTQQRRYAQVARTSADLLLGVINNILDLSRIESGKLELDAVAFNPAELVEEVVSVLAIQAEDKGLELACHVQPEVDRWVSGDRGRLRQVLTNLIANAIKFTERGEVAVRALLEEIADRHVGIRFTVSDTGIGIPRDRMDRLFRPFSQVDASTTRRFGGSGLGLAISRYLTQMMGGQIGVESVVGRGSTFWFTVRLELTEPGHVAARPDPGPLRGVRALVVDDNATNRQILEGQLTAWGMACTTAADGPEALARLHAAARSGCPFDLALLDMHMPGMDGEQLGRAIKADRLIASTILVAITSITHRATAAGWKVKGFSGWAAKPVSRPHLLDVIVTALRGADPVAGETSSPGPREDPGLASDEGTPRPEARRALRILVAEDSHANQLVATGLLERLGHTGQVADDGALAVAAFREGAFDLVLMDVQMPGMDGFQAAAAIRALETSRGTHTPIVAVTAHAVRGDRERCLAAGMDAYLSKPLRRRELERVIEELFPAGPPVGVADRGAALARLEGDEQLLADLIDITLREWPPLVAAIRGALAEGHLAAVGFKAHRLNGLARTFEARGAVDAAARLEAAAAGGDRAAAGAACAEVEAQFARLRDALAGWCRHEQPGASG